MDDLRDLIGDEMMDRVLDRLRGAPHTHTDECIHNLTADEQIILEGYTREQWAELGFGEPVVI